MTAELASPPRTRKALDLRRSELLERGLVLFSQKPYDEVSISDIANEAGVSKGLLYHYFGGKRPFYVECVKVIAGQLLETTGEPPNQPDPRHAVAAVTAYLDFAEHHRAPYVALMRSGIGYDPEVSAILDQTRARFVDRMLTGMGLGAPRPVFTAVARCWIRQVEGACLDWLETREVERAVLVRLLMGSLLGMLMTAKQLDPSAPFVVPPIPIDL